MPFSSSIRVGLVGYGFSGKTFHAPLIRAVPGLDLVAVVSRNADKVQADLPGVIVEANPLALVTSSLIDLVVIATPNETHAPIARVALAAGKHVVIDKPFALDMREARELIALSRQHDRLLSVFHNRRWDSDFLTVRRSIIYQHIGEVTHFESHFDRFRPQVRDRWRERADPGSGLWFDLGPHLVDQALQLFGLPDRVHGNLARQRAGALTDDWAHVVLDYEERRVILHGGSLVAGGSHRFVVHGTGGSLVKRMPDRQEQQLLDGLQPGALGWGDDPDPLIVHAADGSTRYLPATSGDQRMYYRGIAEAFNGNRDNLATDLQSLAVMAVLEAAEHSSRTGTATSLDLTPTERAAWS
ncbi:MULTISPECIES: oxidoreductase [Pseudomonadota]|uniref:oxidoreductase n=1 Tax=Pseudomonadota TaxID=1224 RepID=UPI00093BFECC|nr:MULTISPECIES: oxidoreductase [Pseudomonadota]MBX6317001.1 oxidoreductase [Pigmentiphaga sp.]